MPQLVTNHTQAILLLPTSLKEAAREAAKQECSNLSAYIRMLIVADLKSRNINYLTTPKNQ